jgi:hypothetical protein
MASKLIIHNQSRTHDYRVVLDSTDAGDVFPLRSIAIDVPPGEHQLSFREVGENDLPTACKPIHMTIEDEKTLELSVSTKHFSIQIHDRQDTLLNGRHGFLCGRICDGVRIDNTIT